MKHQLKRMTCTLCKSVSLAICSTIFILTSCCNNTTSNNSQAFTDTSNNNKRVFPSATRIIEDKKYWSGITPVDFLDTLKKYGDSTFFRIDEKPDSSWFKDTYIIELRKHCNDTSQSAIVFTIYDSHAHDDHGSSTVREQAIYLIQSYATNNYPHSICSGAVDTTGWSDSLK